METFTPLFMLLNVLLSITSCFGEPLIMSTGELDKTAVKKHILQLEETVSDLKAQFKVQEEKQAALVSSLLSKYASMSDELSKLQSDFSNLETEHNSTLLELSDVKEELSTYKVELNKFRNCSTLTGIELSRVDANLNATIITTKVNSDMIAKLEGNMSQVRADILSQKYDLNKTTVEMKEVRDKAESTSLAQKTIQTGMLKMDSQMHNITDAISDIGLSINTSFSSLSCAGPEISYQVTEDTATASVNSRGILVLNNVIHNLGGGYQNKTGEFRAPVGGTYLFWAQVMEGDSKPLTVYLVKQNVHMHIAYIPAGTAYNTASLTAILELKENDAVWVQTTKNSILVGYKQTNYGGVLLCKH